jgi:hypothetical protein
VQQPPATAHCYKPEEQVPAEAQWHRHRDRSTARACTPFTKSENREMTASTVIEHQPQQHNGEYTRQATSSANLPNSPASASDTRAARTYLCTPARSARAKAENQQGDFSRSQRATQKSMDNNELPCKNKAEVHYLVSESAVVMDFRHKKWIAITTNSIAKRQQFPAINRQGKT